VGRGGGHTASRKRQLVSQHGERAQRTAQAQQQAQQHSSRWLQQSLLYGQAAAGVVALGARVLWSAAQRRPASPGGGCARACSTRQRSVPARRPVRMVDVLPK
jgi:hypothetical protein